MKTDYRKVAKELNEFAKAGTYDKPAVLRAEFTRFEAVHKAMRGRNGVGELVDLRTQVIEADGILIDPDPRLNYLSVYLNAVTRDGHGFGSDKGVFLRLKDAKGRYHSLTVKTEWKRSEINVDSLMRIIGEDAPSTLQPEEFKLGLEDRRSRVVRLVDSETDGTESEWELGQRRREFAKEFYRSLTRELDDGRTETLEAIMAHVGGKVVTVFLFTERYRIFNPDYFEATASGFEVGWHDTQTYNSLPCVLKVSKARSIKTVKLSDLDVERSGYYSHGDQMRVLPEQVPQVKRFAARFRSKATKLREKALASALKAG